MSDTPDLPSNSAAHPLIERTTNGRFADGNRGGPGRPRGPMARPSAIDRAAAEAMPDLIEALLSKVREGDKWAMDRMMQRLWPVPKGRALEVDVPAVVSRFDVRPAQEAVTEAVLTGQGTPQEGADVIAVIEAQQRCIKSDEVARKLDAIDRRYGSRD